MFESSYILEWLEAMHPAPPLMPPGRDDRLAARRIEVLADGVCDAFVLLFMERMRPEAQQSRAWMDRQQRKIDGGLAEMARLLGDKAHFIGDAFTLADLAAATVTSYLSVRWPEIDWRAAYPALLAHSDRMEQRPSFQSTRPVPQTISDAIV